MSDPGSLEALVERLLARVRELESVVEQQRRVIAEQADRIVELERRLGRDSSTSSRPPSSDAPWDKQLAKKRSSRSRSGRKPGKQSGCASASRGLVDDPDETFEVAPDHCARCEKPLDDAAETARVRRQVADVAPPPPPKVTEYQLVSRRCGGCGQVNDPTPTDVPRPVNPGSDVARRTANAPEQARDEASMDGWRGLGFGRCAGWIVVGVQPFGVLGPPFLVVCAVMARKVWASMARVICRCQASQVRTW